MQLVFPRTSNKPLKLWVNSHNTAITDWLVCVHVRCRGGLRPRRAAVPKPGRAEASRLQSLASPCCVWGNWGRQKWKELAWVPHWVNRGAGRRARVAWTFHQPLPPPSHALIWAFGFHFAALLGFPSLEARGSFEPLWCNDLLFFRGFPVKLTMKNKTPRRSWSSFQWLKLHCAHSKWHGNVWRTAHSWIVPCSCA